MTRIASRETRPHYVYRCYDADGRLLYIGCARDVVARMDVHRSSWTNPASAALNMRMTRHTSERYPTKSAARQAEREAIYNEAPLFNHHHQKVMRTVAERRAVIEEYLQATRPAFDADQFASILAVFAGGPS